MTFDLERDRARLLSEIRNTDNSDGDKAAVCLDVATAALDEIERLQKENLELNVAIVGPDQIRAHQKCIIDDQAKRIAELEVDNQRWREYNQQLYKANRKKHAALKVLGKRSGKRGKALVEERAKLFHQFGDMELDSSEDDRRMAREQLRREGKL